MTIGMHTLQLAVILEVERRLEADRHRCWRFTPAAGTSAPATAEWESPVLGGRLTGRRPRRA